ncbi:hypothetical protein SAMN05661080_04919 [Modestobacter sp. DSM 44400]|nr:hypothetical protein SAMN05661080_04919 [Modestobacter sp. DSM 44400]
MTDSDRAGLRQRRTRLWFGGLFAWLCVGIVVSEFRDPPFDPVRVLFNLVLATLMAWFLAWLFVKVSRNKS